MRMPFLKRLWGLPLALRLVLLSQAVSGSPIPVVIRRMQRLAWLLPRGLTPAEAEWLTLKACSVASRLPRVFTSCIVRSLVAATLLSDSEGVEMHIGFRDSAERNPGDSLGHAWVTMGERVVVEIDSPENPTAQGRLLRAHGFSVNRWMNRLDVDARNS